ncbi:hypothetical protein NDU88_003942 [Pleurodeles waltl]|uniref:Uncharacterized protein n=1 Tax=Pleurodeles waltl TaxID=8319 RepID=A0AAV7WWQ4_PLEWA|nr:hypothetical protein NDU88_003942 [Pleurodeles waltl]
MAELLGEPGRYSRPRPPCWKHFINASPSRDAGRRTLLPSCWGNQDATPGPPTLLETLHKREPLAGRGMPNSVAELLGEPGRYSRPRPPCWKHFINASPSRDAELCCRVAGGTRTLLPAPPTLLETLHKREPLAGRGTPNSGANLLGEPGCYSRPHPPCWKHFINGSPSRDAGCRTLLPSCWGNQDATPGPPTLLETLHKREPLPGRRTLLPSCWGNQDTTPGPTHLVGNTS